MDKCEKCDLCLWNQGSGGGGGSSGVTIIEGVYNAEASRIECSITGSDLLAAVKQGVVMIHDSDESGFDETFIVIYGSEENGVYTFVGFVGNGTYKTSNLSGNDPVVFSYYQL